MVVDLEAGATMIQIDRRCARGAAAEIRWRGYLTTGGGLFPSVRVGRGRWRRSHPYVLLGFNDVIVHRAMDADVISIASRSKMELDAFKTYKYPNEIGPASTSIAWVPPPMNDRTAAAGACVSPMLSSG